MSITKNETRKQRHVRVRKKVYGTPERPRLNVYRSNKNIAVQIIDDTVGRTLVAASSTDASLKDSANGGNIAGAQAVGKLIAEKAQAAGVTSVVFDRGGYLYHGRIKALADAAREGGLDF